MIRIALIAAAMTATIAAATSAAAQTGGPVRTLGGPETAATVISVATRKAAPCADKACAGKPAKRETYVAPAPLGW